MTACLSKFFHRNILQLFFDNCNPEKIVGFKVGPSAGYVVIRGVHKSKLLIRSIFCGHVTRFNWVSLLASSCHNVIGRT